MRRHVGCCPLGHLGPWPVNGHYPLQKKKGLEAKSTLQTPISPQPTVRIEPSLCARTAPVIGDVLCMDSHFSIACCRERLLSLGFRETFKHLNPASDNCCREPPPSFPL